MNSQGLWTAPDKAEEWSERHILLVEVLRGMYKRKYSTHNLMFRLSLPEALFLQVQKAEVGNLESAT